jgi:hypothetical protein
MNEISLLIKLIIFNLVIFFFRIIYTEERLQKMNKSPNGGCHFCKDPENLMHLFVN